MVFTYVDPVTPDVIQVNVVATFVQLDRAEKPWRVFAILPGSREPLEAFGDTQVEAERVLREQIDTRLHSAPDMTHIKSVGSRVLTVQIPRQPQLV